MRGFAMYHRLVRSTRMPMRIGLQVVQAGYRRDGLGSIPKTILALYLTIRFQFSPLESLANRDHPEATSVIYDTSGFFGQKISKQIDDATDASLFRILKYE